MSEAGQSSVVLVSPSISSVSFSAGCPEPERLAGPVVELAGDLVELCLIHPGEALAFREVLAKEAVGVLVGPALPRAAGIAEVDLDAGLDAEPTVRCHLLSLIPGKRAAKLDGQRLMLALSASQTGSALVPSGSATSGSSGSGARPGSRSRSCVPISKSPSQCPGTARSRPLVGARRSSPSRDAARALPALGVRPGIALLRRGSQMPGELASQRPPRLDIQRAVDRLVRDLHRLIVGV